MLNKQVRDTITRSIVAVIRMHGPEAGAYHLLDTVAQQQWPYAPPTPAQMGFAFASIMANVMLEFNSYQQQEIALAIERIIDS